MTIPPAKWQIISAQDIPLEFIKGVKKITSRNAKYCAQLLWQRGIQDLEKLSGFLDPAKYLPADVNAFGQEISWAVERLQQARSRSEKVTIWGDFDADGITSTSVLWDGLGQFFTQHLQLDYYIPNRLTESHGLNCPGIASLAEAGTKLIVTCDTGSTNIEEIEYAQDLGIDIIITDHHTLPEFRPQVAAIVNPRYLTKDHPLYNLSGVAVAYKLVEALYMELPDVPSQPLENLLDLVAIGLIADLVELKGDCRYLAQVGIEQLQKQVKADTMTRPGVAKLLELCRRNGDRPTDISFGLGPRINAVSRIHGDASFCVELLTSSDPQRCSQLAEEAELANTRRKSLQKDTIKQVTKKLDQLDLSTTSVIVLEDPQWQGGVLGLAAGQIAQEYGRPTVLLSSGEDGDSGELMARGSARSVNGIDLYGLVKSQSNLLHRFGGHPFAAGLSLPVANLNLFKEGINQQLRQQTNVTEMTPQIDVDLVVRVEDLGPDLFNELRLLEPYGMGNPIPKLLIKNCWFKNAWNKNIQDRRGQQVQFIRTTFNIWDDSVQKGFPGLWWGHYKDEIPVTEKCEAIAELDFNTYSKQYEIRLIALRPMSEASVNSSASSAADSEQLVMERLIDRRSAPHLLDDLNNLDNLDNPHNPHNSHNSHNLDSLAIPLSQTSILQPTILKQCPTTWGDIRQEYQRAINGDRSLVLAYTPDNRVDAIAVWRQLVGIAKYLARSTKQVSKAQIKDKLDLSDRTFCLGLEALEEAGFKYKLTDNLYQFYGTAGAFQDMGPNSQSNSQINSFLSGIEEEKFQQEYFYQVPLSTINQHLLSN